MLTCWHASTSCPVAGSVNDPARPPSRGRASSTVTREPRGASPAAAASPARPPPTTITRFTARPFGTQGEVWGGGAPRVPKPVATREPVVAGPQRPLAAGYAPRPPRPPPGFSWQSPARRFPMDEHPAPARYAASGTAHRTRSRHDARRPRKSTRLGMECCSSCRDVPALASAVLAGTNLVVTADDTATNANVRLRPATADRGDGGEQDVRRLLPPR